MRRAVRTRRQPMSTGTQPWRSDSTARGNRYCRHWGPVPWMGRLSTGSDPSRYESNRNCTWKDDEVVHGKPFQVKFVHYAGIPHRTPKRQTPAKLRESAATNTCHVLITGQQRGHELVCTVTSCGSLGVCRVALRLTEDLPDQWSSRPGRRISATSSPYLHTLRQRPQRPRPPSFKGSRLQRSRIPSQPATTTSEDAIMIPRGAKAPGDVVLHNKSDQQLHSYQLMFQLTQNRVRLVSSHSNYPPRLFLRQDDVV